MNKTVQFYKDVLDSLYDGVYFVDKERRITYWNNAAARITGFCCDEVLGKHCSANILTHVDDHGANLCETTCPLAATITDGQVRETDIYLHHKDGHRVPVSVRVSPIRNSNGEIDGVVELFSDNTPKGAILQRIEELEKLALIDVLTGLGNRRFAEMSLQTRLKELERFGWPMGLIFMDIDCFKRINDSYGHDMGDRVLAMVAKTLLNNSRPFDTFGRWAGDELIGIIRNVDSEILSITAERLRMLVEKSYIANGAEPIRVTVSMGVTLALGSDSIMTLINRADTLMYRSKKDGGNRLTTDVPDQSIPDSDNEGLLLTAYA